MIVCDLIRKKRDGGILDEEELRFFLSSFLSGEMPDYQAAAFLMAVLLRGMAPAETASLTRLMIESGRVLRFEGLPGPLVDKHSTGGVGDKISIPLAAVAAECGLFVPMITGRALGHTGGTLDKLESIPGMRTDFPAEGIARLVRENGACFAAQTAEIVPADRRLYALRDATATVESVPLIVSSILSKKCAEGVRAVVIDVKCGRGAFMDTLPRARELADALEATGEAMGMPVKTVVTAMDEPIGRTVGNALEIGESIRILEGRGPKDATALTLRLAAEMLLAVALVSSLEDGESLARSAMESGRALERFSRIVSAQGGRIDFGEAGYGLPVARIARIRESPAAGYLSRLDARIIGEAVREMGGGRARMGDAIDPAAGVVLFRKTGDYVARGEPLFEIHASSEEAAQNAALRLDGAVLLSDEPVRPGPIVIG